MKERVSKYFMVFGANLLTTVQINTEAADGSG